MVTLTLSRVPEGSSDYHVIATMRIAQDGTYQVEDPEKVLPVQFAVLITNGTSPEQSGAVSEVSVDQDAELWARNLKNFLRTGYLVPAIHEDDATAPEVGDPVPISEA